MNDKAPAAELLGYIGNTTALLDDHVARWREFTGNELLQLGRGQLAGMLVSDFIADYYTAVATFISILLLKDGNRNAM